MSEPTVSPDEEPCGHKAGGCENASTGTRDGLCSACFFETCDHEEEALEAALAKAFQPVRIRLGTVYSDERIAEIKREAQREALESVAKEMCPLCAGWDGFERTPIGSAEFEEGGWAHRLELPRAGSAPCSAVKVWKVAARLRSEAGSGSEPGK